MLPNPLKQLNDQQRHDYILKNYILKKANNTEARRFKRDIDVIKDHHRFLYEDHETVSENHTTWEQRLARRYYDKLFKEYCIANLTYYKHNKIALRWRIESEVVSGKGQFQCGSLKCGASEELRSWEVNFAYMEHGEKKNALVKLRLCPEHSRQLNYKSQKREVKRIKKQQIKESKTRKNTNKKQEESIPVVKETEIAVIEKVIEEITETSENIWNKKVEIENEQESREKEFERYLEDLLL